MLNLPLSELVQRIQSQEITACAVMNAIYDNIDALNSKLNAYSYVLERQVALQKAEAIDQKAQRGESLGGLAGIPVAIKNNMCTKSPELPTTCSSKILEGFYAPYDATVVEALEKHDAIIIGKANMDEFAMGSSTENSADGSTKNPWDLERVPGGSSGGSAVTVAAQMALLALGSDTGGSIRQPASMCGVTGLKPSYGTVSRYGLVAFGSSLDQIGWFTRSAEDAAYVFPMLSGHDERDSTSAKVEYPEAPAVDLSKLKLGLPKEYIEHPAADPKVIQSVMSMLDKLKEQGATIEECSIPITELLVPTYYLLSFAEASSNLGRYDGVRYGRRAENPENLEALYKRSRSEGFGPEVKRRIMIGTFALSAGYYDAYYGKASKVRQVIQYHVQQLFEQYDYIIAPVAPTPAFKLNEKMEDPLAMYLCDIYSVIANLSYSPAISIPSSTTDEGLPVGVQLMGPRFEDRKLLATCEAIQNVTDFHKAQPTL